MSPKQCPLCGNPIEEDNEKFCSDCRNINEQSGVFSESVFSKHRPDENEPAGSPDGEEVVENRRKGGSEVLARDLKRKKKLKVWAIIISILVLLGIATGCYLFMQYQFQNDRQELAFWNNSLRINTSKSYLDYIAQYPDGKYVKDAQSNILRYNQSLRKFWENIKHNGTEDEILAFLHKYGQTPYCKEASDLLDSIAWVNVLKLNTEESYKSYLDRTEKKELKGTYKTLAQEKYDYFAQMEFVGGDEWKNVEKALSVFFRQLSSQSYGSLKLLLAQTIKKFYTMTDVSPDGIVASMKNEMVKEDIASMQIVPDTEQMQVKRDNKGCYIIELTAQKEIIYNKSKEKSDVESHFLIVLDSNLKVVELNELKKL